MGGVYGVPIVVVLLLGPRKYLVCDLGLTQQLVLQVEAVVMTSELVLAPLLVAT